MRKLQLAILDLYEGTPNQGMRCIIETVNSYQEDVESHWFDVRRESQVPDIHGFDIFILSGGPGDPREGNGIWEKKLYQLFDDIYEYNMSCPSNPKFMFLICHSFQMAANHYGLGKVTRRKSPSFGTTVVHKHPDAKDEPMFKGLTDPFFAADFRSFQVISPNMERMDEMGARIILLEKRRDHIKLERAIMGIRFMPSVIGVQFHPEADAPGMLNHFQSSDVAISVLKEHGKDNLERLIRDLSHPEKIDKTHKTILPNFMNDAIKIKKGALEKVIIIGQ